MPTAVTRPADQYRADFRARGHILWQGKIPPPIMEPTTRAIKALSRSFSDDCDMNSPELKEPPCTQLIYAGALAFIRYRE